MTSSRKMECTELLSHVQRAESLLPESSDAYFGHPPPPKLHVIQMLPRVYLGAAVTKRCVSAQLWVEDRAMAEPIEIFCLAPPYEESDEEEETITCATVLSLDRNIKGDDSTIYAAIAVGTNCSRVLSVQLQIEYSADSEKPVLSLLPGVPPFEPLSLDPPEDVPDDSSVISDASRHSRRSRTDSLRGSKHGSPKKESALSSSLHESKKGTPAAQKPIKFRPSGGISSISLYNIALHDKAPLTPIVWVAYGDGTSVRLHQAAFFSSVVHDERFFNMLASAVLRSRVLLPPSVEGATVVPLPKYHPSPLAPLPPWKPALDEDEIVSPASTNLPSDDDDQEEDVEEFVPDFHEALVFAGGTGMGEQMPALAFYTSENQFVGRISGDDKKRRNGSSEQDSAILDHVIGGTSMLVRGVFGTALGVMKWGLGKSEETPEEKAMDRSDVDMLEPGEEEMVVDLPFVSPMFPALHSEQSSLVAGFEIHDAPRQITSVSVDPDGNLAATTDTLGRVLLIDLCAKQVVRMWKGVREAACAWIEIPRLNVDKPWQKQKITYLVIHSQQRRTVEVYRTRHGPRVKSMQVGRDAQLIQSIGHHGVGSIACCYLLHSSAPGTSLNQIELLAVNDEPNGSRESSNDDSVLSLGRSSTSMHEAAMRLQLLQQLLAETNVPSERQDVFQALTQIISLKDLCTALDVLAVASQLEEAMGVIGAEFHSVAVAHCKQILANVIRDGGDESLENTQVKLLASRITYHTQLVEAYGILHEFETKNYGDEEQDERVAPRSAWAVEAMAWLTMYETVTGSSIDAGVIGQARPVLRFWSFAKACADSKQIVSLAEGADNVRHKIYLTDSTKTRREVLVHIFKPLLRDIFAFNVVCSIFDAMGINNDFDYLLKCFGDWFVSIPAREAARKGLFGLHSPIVRWLQDMVANELEASQSGSAGSETSGKPLLLGLYKFCSEATGMVRSFLLATLCREAVSIATKKKEVKTYGMISSADAVKPWDELLRKLRVCLLVSLRLNGMNLGQFPITVKNVEAKDTFSVYEWLARDELTMSHKQDEIVSLENACKVSGLVFDPSSPAGDNPGRWKMLQQACLAAAISEEEREEYLLDMNDDDQLGALLLYLSSHNNPAVLVAHRALLLARKFVQEPSDLRALASCLDALRGLHDDKKHKPLSAAIRLQVWQSAIRPFYRAVLVGFDDVHELTEDIAGPLLDNRGWLVGLGKIALPVLGMLSQIVWDDTMNTFESDIPADNTSWPPVKQDFILKRVVETSRPINMNALNAHRVIVCGTLVSDDMETLSDAVPDLLECFLPASLFQSTGSAMESTEKQMEFLEQAVIDRANEVEGKGFLGRLDLGEIETLAQLWNVDLRDIRTLFLLAMYELGKDHIVDEALSTCSASTLDVERFVTDGLGIACRRLNRTLNLKRSSKMRSIMGMLDADTCEWIREQAESSLSLLEGDDGDARVALANTHLLILRLLSLCSTSGNKVMASKIHSLSILSGTLLKALEDDR